MKAVNAVTTSWAGLHVDRPTFAAVADAELDAVHRYLVFLTGDRAVAEDLTGDTFEKAFRTWRRFDPRRGTARAWLCQIARSIALDHFRSEERRRRREERYARPVRAVDEPELGPSPLAAASHGCRRQIARSSRCGCCWSSTARRPRGCSGSVRQLARRA